MLDTLSDALGWALALTTAIAMLFVIGSISPKKNKNEHKKPNAFLSDDQDGKPDRADNPYTDDDDFSFREPKWHPPPHRHREEDSDSVR